MGYNLLGKKLTELRAKSGLTQAELAEKLHYTAQTVSNWERGVSSPGPETLLAIAEFFGVTTDELLGKESAAKEERAPLTESAQKRTERTEFYSEPTIAAKGFRILLYLSTGLAPLLILLLLVGDKLSLMTFSAFAILFRLLLIADYILLMISKEWVDSLSLKTVFLGVLIAGNILSFFDEKSFIANILYIAASLGYYIMMAFVFRPAAEKREDILIGRIVYFVGFVLLFFFTIVSLVGKSFFFGLLFLFAWELFGFWCIKFIAKDRMVKIPYRTERAVPAALFTEPNPEKVTISAEPKREREYRPDILLSAMFWTAAGCWVLLAFMSPAPLAALAICGAFVPFAFFTVFWFVKEGMTNRVLHWMSFAVWVLCMLTACYMFFSHVFGDGVRGWVFWTFEVSCLAAFILVVLLFRGSLRAGAKAAFIVFAVLFLGIACFFGGSGMEDGFQMMATITVTFYLLFFFLAGLKMEYRKEALFLKRKSNRE